MPTLLPINTPAATIAASGVSANTAYIFSNNAKTPYVTIYNAGTVEAKVWSGDSSVTITGNNFMAVPPGAKETFSVNINDTHFAATGAGNVYAWRGSGE